MREVHHADALDWLRARGVVEGCSYVTSMPDVSEVGLDVARWRPWFEEAAGLVLRAVPDDGVAVFFQTDLRTGGVTVDKAGLVERTAEDAGLVLVFSKIVCRLPPGTTTFGRPAFTRFLAFARRPCPVDVAIPDVIVDAGARTWTRAVGVRAVAHAVRFVRAASPSTTTIVDPFCGVGTFLAVANALGFSAVGVEKNKRRAAQARLLEVRATDL